MEEVSSLRARLVKAGDALADKDAQYEVLAQTHTLAEVCLPACLPPHVYGVNFVLVSSE